MLMLMKNNVTCVQNFYILIRLRKLKYCYVNRRYINIYNLSNKMYTGFWSEWNEESHYNKQIFILKI